VIKLRLTVGICAYNEEKNIGHLLENILAEQQLPLDTEILIVCSGCTDRTVKIVQEHACSDSRVHAYVENERCGKASAVNYILANAKGEVILFISADTLPHERCFTNLTSNLGDAKVGLVCGKPLPVNRSKSLSDTLVNILWQSHDYIFQRLNNDGLARHASEIFCVRAGIVKQIPAEMINDDAYVALAVKNKGWLIKYDPDATVSICGPRTFSDYFKQRKRVLIGHWQIKKSTGNSPQHLLYLLPLYPKKVAELVLGLCEKQGLMSFAIFVWAEFLINLSTIPTKINNKPCNLWKVAPSTKELIRA
jgi:biofilm PGA synthesis N-glycosyltransferase PgaC